MKARAAIPVILAGLASMAMGADYNKAFSDWSDLEFDTAKLARGKIATKTNTSMALARGLSAHAVYLVPTTSAVVEKTLFHADPTKRPGSEVYQHKTFRTEAEAAFDSLKLDTKLGTVRKLIDIFGKRDGVQLSPAESGKKPSGAGAVEIASFFSTILRDRWNAAKKGDLSEVDGQDLRAEIKSLLAGEPKLSEHFSELLTPLTKSPNTWNPTLAYWNVSKVDGVATAALGSMFRRTQGDRIQVLDVVHYVSSGYYTSFSVFEFVPVTIDGKTQTLAWQCSVVSSPQLAGGFGVKRQVASVLMKNELEQAVRFLQRDAIAFARE